MRNPYIIGPYVTGSQHYGREALIDYLLHGPSHASWVIGGRRTGKTSLLRQIEMLTGATGELVPLYWNIQGCDTYSRLGQSLADTLRDGAERFEPLRAEARTILSEDDPLALLASLRRLASRAQRRVLLLGDEMEALVQIARSEPEAMQRLHRELVGGAGLRVVMTSTRVIFQMHDVCREWRTSAFLDGFDMSQMLGSLSYQGACALITQAQAPTGEQVQVTPDVILAISEHTNNHPFLLQSLCARLFDESGWLRPVTEEDLGIDQAMAGLFSGDFDDLTAADRQVVVLVHAAGTCDEAALQKVADETATDLHRRLRNLERLGYLRRTGLTAAPRSGAAAAGNGTVCIGNRFLADWLSARHAEAGAANGRASLTESGPAPTSDAAMHLALERQQSQETDFLVSQLDACRTRLVALEIERARDLLSVSPQVLAEIEQIQSEIRRLRWFLAG